MNKSTATIRDLVVHEPITENQTKAYEAWDDGDNIILAGSAGTGKTFIALYLALEAVLEKATPYKKIILVRSVVPTRDMGFLPGTMEEKKGPYEIPYQSICSPVSLNLPFQMHVFDQVFDLNLKQLLSLYVKWSILL